MIMDAHDTTAPGLRRQVFATLVLLVASLSLAGCQAADSGSTSGPRADLDTECRDSRPEMCTEQYLPVCGLRETGVRCVTAPCPATEWRTYSNGCKACSDPKVIGYKADACDELSDR